MARVPKHLKGTTRSGIYAYGSSCKQRKKESVAERKRRKDEREFNRLRNGK